MITGTTAADPQRDDAEALRRENAPETRDYRHFVRRVWELQRAGFQAAVADAIERGVEPDTARREAAQAIRGDLRALMSELLTRAPIPVILDFLDVARTWGDAGEDLFDGHQRDVVTLLESAYPTPTWTELPPLDRDEAEDEQVWAAWSATWGTTLAVSDPVAAAFFQRVAKEAKASAEATPKRRWAPWIIAAAVAGLGVTALVVFARRHGRGHSPAPMPEWSVQAFGGAPRAHRGMHGRVRQGAEATSSKGWERPMKIFDGVQIQPTFGPMLQNILAIASILGGTLIEADRHRKERLAEEYGEPRPRNPLEEVMAQSGLRIPGLSEVLEQMMGGGDEAKRAAELITSSPDLATLLQAYIGHAGAAQGAPGASGSAGTAATPGAATFGAAPTDAHAPPDAAPASMWTAPRAHEPRHQDFAPNPSHAPTPNHTPNPAYAPHQEAPAPHFSGVADPTGYAHPGSPWAGHAWAPPTWGPGPAPLGYAAPWSTPIYTVAQGSHLPRFRPDFTREAMTAQGIRVSHYRPRFDSPPTPSTPEPRATSRPSAPPPPLPRRHAAPTSPGPSNANESAPPTAQVQPPAPTSAASAPTPTSLPRATEGKAGSVVESLRKGAAQADAPTVKKKPSLGALANTLQRKFVELRFHVNALAAASEARITRVEDALKALCDDFQTHLNRRPEPTTITNPAPDGEAVEVSPEEEGKDDFNLLEAVTTTDEAGPGANDDEFEDEGEGEVTVTETTSSQWTAPPEGAVNATIDDAVADPHPAPTPAPLPVDSAFLVLTPADLEHATRDDLLGALTMISDFANELGERHQRDLARIGNLERELFTLRAVLDHHRHATPVQEAADA